MKTYPTTRPARALLFDIDNTLYRDDGYVRRQVAVVVDRLASEFGVAFAALGVPIEVSVARRRELINPAEFLAYDGLLTETITDPATRYRPAAITTDPSATDTKGTSNR